MGVKIQNLPTTAAIAISTIWEIVTTPGTVPTSQKCTAAQIATFLSTNLPSINTPGTIQSGANLIAADNIEADQFQCIAGNITYGGALSQVDGNFRVDSVGQLVCQHIDINGGNIININSIFGFGILNLGNIASDNAGNFNVAGVYEVASIQVVGPQQGAIPDAVGGTEIATINAILAALRAHGLIAT